MGIMQKALIILISIFLLAIGIVAIDKVRFKNEGIAGTENGPAGDQEIPYRPADDYPDGYGNGMQPEPYSPPQYLPPTGDQNDPETARAQGAYVQGTVLQNVTKYAAMDGPTYLIVEADGRKMRVTYAQGMAPCRNVIRDAVSIQPYMKVAVFGRKTSDTDLNICDSPDYYIRILN